MKSKKNFFIPEAQAKEWLERDRKEREAFNKKINQSKEIEKNVEISKEILEEIKKIIKKYIDTTEENINILALWCLGTYFHKEFQAFPILQFMAQKRSGKTRTLKLLSSLSYGSDGSVSTSPTETLLFRHKEGALFFDEMENISSKERSAFRETLNAVYKQGNKIVRYKEAKINGTKEYVEESFYPYYPVALANIAGFGDVLTDRAIQIILRRSNKKLTKLVEDFSTNKDILSLKERLYHLNASIPKDFFVEWNKYIEKKDFDEKLKPLFEKIDRTKIYGRNLEIFFPLFIISYLCDNLDNLLEIAKEYIEQKEEEEQVNDFDEMLKRFLTEKQLSYLGFVSVSDICLDFRRELDNPEDWVNPKWLGRALKRLDFVKNKRLVNGKSQVILKINTTNTTNTINPTNSTNPTEKEVEKVGLVELVEERGVVDKVDNSNTLSKFKQKKCDEKELKEIVNLK